MQHLRPELHRQAYEVRRRNTVVTKMDAPYTFLSIRGQASRVPVSSEVKGKELQAHNVHLQDLMPREPPTVTDTPKIATEVIQRVPKVNGSKQEAQRLREQGYMQARRVLPKPQKRVEEEGDKLTRKEKREKKATASRIQLKRKKIRIAKEAKALIERQPEISKRVALKMARKAAKKAEIEAAQEEKQESYQLQNLATRAAKEANREQSSEGKAFMMHQKNRGEGETDDGPTFAVRFTSQEPEPFRQVTLQPEAQNVPPTTMKRHFAVSSGNMYQKHGTTSVQKIDIKTESLPKSKSFPDDVKYKTKPLQTKSHNSVPIIREESEGESPRTAYKGKDGNVFMMRRHVTMNPFERLQAIQQVGEITSRDQAIVGLHGQYHLKLFDEQPEDVRKC